MTGVSVGARQGTPGGMAQKVRDPVHDIARQDAQRHERRLSRRIRENRSWDICADDMVIDNRISISTWDGAAGRAGRGYGFWHWRSGMAQSEWQIVLTHNGSHCSNR